MNIFIIFISQPKRTYTIKILTKGFHKILFFIILDIILNWTGAGQKC